MPNLLIFNPSVPQTLLNFEEMLSGIKTKLTAYATKEKLPHLVPSKAVWKPEKGITKITWDRILGPDELTCLFLALGSSRTWSLKVKEDVGFLDQKFYNIQDEKFWNVELLAKIAFPHLAYLDKEKLPQFDEAFCRASFLADPPSQLQILDTTIIIDWFNNWRPRTQSFQTWVEGNPLKDSCPWYRQIQQEAREKREATRRAKAQQEEAAKKARLRLIMKEMPRRIMGISDTCPDWLVEIYWKAFNRRMHSDANNGAPETIKKYMQERLQEYNEAHDKLKKQRGSAWNPAQLPWKEEEK